MMSMSKNQDLDVYPQANGGLEPGMAMNQDPDAYPQANGGLEPGMAMSRDPTIFPQANGGLEPGKTFSKEPAEFPQTNGGLEPGMQLDVEEDPEYKESPLQKAGDKSTPFADANWDDDEKPLKGTVKADDDDDDAPALLQNGNTEDGYNGDLEPGKFNEEAGEWKGSPTQESGDKTTPFADANWDDDGKRSNAPVKTKDTDTDSSATTMSNGATTDLNNGGLEPGALWKAAPNTEGSLVDRAQSPPADDATSSMGAKLDEQPVPPNQDSSGSFSGEDGAPGAIPGSPELWKAAPESDGSDIDRAQTPPAEDVDQTQTPDASPEANRGLEPGMLWKAGAMALTPAAAETGAVATEEPGQEGVAELLY